MRHEIATPKSHRLSQLRRKKKYNMLTALCPLFIFNLLSYKKQWFHGTALTHVGITESEPNQPKVNIRPYIKMLSILFTDILLCVYLINLLYAWRSKLWDFVSILTRVRFCRPLHLTRPTGTDKRTSLSASVRW